MAIHILKDEVASQIAAGEVVERPSSVVKELLENALDAEATSIEVSVEQAGKRLIEISDNGSGIPGDELELAVARHATSKLSNAEELFHITTLGFRGEALASIASVAHFTLHSKPAGQKNGFTLTVDGGKVGEMQPIGGADGTTVRVEDLFYNVPARLKFLKHDATERQQIDALVTRYALAYPAIRFKVTYDGKTTLQTPGNGNRREVLSQLYGVDIARQLLEVDYSDGVNHLEGFISPVALTRSNRKEITFFVNGRWVQDVALTTALVQAYHTLLMVGRFPMAMLFLQLPPEEVDVNVHPAKAEVRFRQPDVIFSCVQRASKRALLAYSPVPPLSPGAWQSPSSSFQMPETAEFSGLEDVFPNAPTVSTSSTPTFAQQPLPSGQLPILRLIGQVGATYLVAEGPDGLYLIDQHAAHERVLFERFLKQQSDVIPSQALLQPEVFQLPSQTSRLFQNQMQHLNKLGFDVEMFGQDTYRVRAIPALFSGADPVAAVRVVVEDFEEDEAPLQNEIEAKIAARVCKRVAVKAGKVLTVEEQRALLQDLEACNSPRTCPHGRPTMIHLSVDLLERQFGRRGSR
jgi:DNA mismatch repair protein MutL